MKLVKKTCRVLVNDDRDRMIPTEKRAADSIAEIAFARIREQHEADGQLPELVAELRRYSKMLKIDSEDAFYSLMSDIRAGGNNVISDIAVTICWEKDILMNAFNETFSRLAEEYLEIADCECFDADDLCVECDCPLCDEENDFSADNGLQMELNLNVDNLTLNVDFIDPEIMGEGDVNEQSDRYM